MAIVDGVIPPTQAATTKEHRAYVEEGDLFEGNQQPSMKQSVKQQTAVMNVYVEESVKVLESLIIQADPLLQELASIVKEFEDKSQMSALDRDQDMIKKYG